MVILKSFLAGFITSNLVEKTLVSAIKSAKTIVLPLMLLSVANTFIVPLLVHFNLRIHLLNLDSLQFILGRHQPYLSQCFITSRYTDICIICIPEFSKSRLNFKHFQKKDDAHSLFIFEARACEKRG